MKYEEFQNLARLSVLGSLDEDEKVLFEQGRCVFGPRAEAFIRECEKLAMLMALSLEPIEPKPETKKKLMDQIRELQRETPAAPPEEKELASLASFGFEGRGVRKKGC